MTQPHAEITRDDDGTIHAISPAHQMTILPDGEARAFNRVFKHYRMGGGPLHARLNTIAANIQQGKCTLAEAWDEVQKLAKEPTQENEDRYLVGELNGVRVYVHGSSIIMTTRDLYK